MEAANVKVTAYRVGAWLPTDHAFLVGWLEAMIQKAGAEPRALHPVIEEFQALIETDAAIFMLFNQMFEQVPRHPPYNRDPTGKPQVRDYRHMLQLLNSIPVSYTHLTLPTKRIV